MLPIIRVNKKPNLSEIKMLISDLGGEWQVFEASPEASQGVLENSTSWVSVDYFPEEDGEPPYFELGLYGPSPELLAKQFAVAAIEKWGGTTENLVIT